jgi:ParB family chromosome partitioning protein
MKTTYKILPIDYLQPGHYQPRQRFDKDALNDLAQSILAQGLIEPLIVRELSPQRYEIIAGERRWRAAALASLSEVPCLIGTYTDQQAAAVTLIENIQRQDLNLLEEASGYQRLHSEFHFSQDEISALVGKSRSHIANILRLLTLCASVQNRLRARQLSLGHARMLVGLTDQQQETLAEQVEEQGWSVRRLEEEVRSCKRVLDAPPPASKDRDILHLQSQLAEQIGSPVQIITDNEQGGWLKIKFFDNDTLAGLLERMGLRYD